MFHGINHRKYYFKALLAALMLFFSNAPVSAAVQIVTATGQAVDTGAGGSGAARRRALEDALYQAALKGGAMVDGITVIDSKVLTVDQTRIRPKSQILDYQILDSEKSHGFYRITVKAVVGDKPEPRLCQRRSQLHAAIYAPQMALSPYLPAHLSSWLPALERSYFEALDSLSYITTNSYPHIMRPGQDRTRIEAALDYTSLTTGRRASAAPSGEAFAITSKITLSPGPRPTPSKPHKTMRLLINVHIQSPAKYGPAQTIELAQDYIYGRDTGFNTIDVLTKPDLKALLTQMQHTVRSTLQAKFNAISCAPLKAALAYENNSLTIPFGAENGLQKGWLAYVLSSDNRYTILEITNLTADRATLRPLNAQINPETMAGQAVAFMSLDG